MLKFISIKNSAIALGTMVFMLLTINNVSVQAMIPEYTDEKDRSLYTKVMKNVFEASDNLNLEYLATLPGAITKGERINFRKLFSEPTDPKQKISPLALAILAGDEGRVNKFLNNADPNDPSFGVMYDLVKFTQPESCRRICYGCAHLALDPHVILGKRFTRELVGPSYLPNLNEISLNSRFKVIDALARAGVKFNDAPLLPIGTDEDVVAIRPLKAIRCYSSWFLDTEFSSQLMARAVLYGANIEKNHDISIPDELASDTNDFRKDLLNKAFNQILKYKIKTENICPSEFVRKELAKIKDRETQTIAAQLKVREEKKSLLGAALRVEKEQIENEMKDLNHRLDSIQQLTF